MSSQQCAIGLVAIFATCLWFSSRTFASGMPTGDVYPIVATGTGRFRAHFVVHFQDSLRSQCKEEIVRPDGSIVRPPRVVAAISCKNPLLRQAWSPEVVRKGREGVAFPVSNSVHHGKPWYRTVTASGLGPKQVLSWGDVLVDVVMDTRLTSENVIVLAIVARDANKVLRVNGENFVLRLDNQKFAVYSFQRGSNVLRQVFELGGIGRTKEMGDFPLVSGFVALSDSEFAVAYISDSNELRYLVINGRTLKVNNVDLGYAGTGAANISTAAIGRRFLIAYHSAKPNEEKNTVKLVSVNVPLEP